MMVNFMHNPRFLSAISLVKYLLLFVLIFGLVPNNSAFAKCVKGDCKNGTGEWVTSDGRSYKGLFVGGRPNGKGRLSYSNGDYLFWRFC